MHKMLRRLAFVCSIKHGKRQNFHHRFSSIANDNAFEMMAAGIRYGEGITAEVGMDFSNMRVSKVCLVTDKNLANLEPVKVAKQSLDQNKISYEVFSSVSIEPTDKSFLEAISFCRANKFDGYLAVGGGSVIDTCKAANLYSSVEEFTLLDYVSPPIGKGLPIAHKLKPMFAVPTTAGTGSETTGQCVFDIIDARYKVGISSRALKPNLALIDPLHMVSLPKFVVAYPGLDVLCHAVESYTAKPYNLRPRPDNPMLRPVYQGCNPISDIWSRQALQMIAKYFLRAVDNMDDMEARSAMLLASCYAGIGFGNAGVHLCHGLSYPISGLVKKFTSPDYDPERPLIPHGLSVAITAPAVFRFTSSSCPERHLQAAEFLGADTRNVRQEDAGKFLADIILKYMYEVNVPDGLESLGYGKDDVEELARGAFLQHRVTKLSPRPASEDDLRSILLNSMKIY